MVQVQFTGDALWERVERAVRQVKQRLQRAVQALEQAEIPYAVVGGNAVQLWIAQVDVTATRTTQDVDFVLRRQDLDAAIVALESVGFQYRRSAGLDMFLEGPDFKARDAVHVLFAGERVSPGYQDTVPELADRQRLHDFWLMPVEALVRMKLTSYRDKDRVHLRDLISVGLVDAAWLERLPAPLAERLRELLDHPE